MAEQTYPRSAAEVFTVLKRVCKDRPFRIERIDEKLRRIRLTTGMSLLSWGESLDVIVYPQPEGCLVHVEGGAKLPINVTANPDRHIEEIFQRLKRALDLSE